VTLHRAEGFGRSIAEAMLLEKLVISTNYSVNLDFTTPDTSLLVDFRYQAIQKENYPNSTGQAWAAPILEDAIRAMRRAVSADQTILNIQSKARKLIEEKYSIAAVGKNYRRALFPAIAK
jgi:glycosyltransferase involved in cell wall biosynthesis